MDVVDADGIARTFHLLDSGIKADGSHEGTLLCVHGNPTWSYLWRELVAAPPPGWRVVAVDQLGMGYSERPTGIRRLGRRIDDLTRLTAELALDGPVITVAHDWGGVLSLGWAAAHRDQLAGIVLTNTAVSQPDTAAAPALIRLARTPFLRRLICEWTPTFVAGPAALSRPTLARAARRGLAAPYRNAGRRRAIADFVADIPLEDDAPSAAALAAVQAALPDLVDVPALILWGPRDPVFSRRYLDDLAGRLPGADVHLFAGASHLVTEDRPEFARVIADWVAARTGAASGGTLAARADPPAVAVSGTPVVGLPNAGTQTPGTPVLSAPVGTRIPGTPVPGAPVTGTSFPDSPVLGAPVAAEAPLGAALTARAASDATSVAVVEPGRAPISFGELEQRVAALAVGLHSVGMRRGDRVSLLVPPGVDLTVAVYACWRVGAVIVVADAGLGLRRLGAALRSAGGRFVIGSAKGLAAARLLRVPGVRILIGPGPGALGEHRAADLTAAAASVPADGSTPELLNADDECAVVFTSGATGPPKGVVYRTRQVRAQIDLITSVYGLGAHDRLVAAFAPFALYGPAFGIASAVPAMDVTAPATLIAAALADAIAAVDATVVFASPAALRNVVATAGGLDDARRAALRRPRLVMSAGAPLELELLREVAALLPGADVHTPYGMTEALPVTDVSLAELEEAGPGDGVCVGRPVDGADVGIAALDTAGAAPSAPQYLVDVPGEICVRAAHLKDRYDRLWATEAVSARDVGWHRTGDVGRLDAEGRLWIEGRLPDVITTERGPVTPVPVEGRLLRVASVRAAAVVGVGPNGAQQAVAVVVPADAAPISPRRTPSRLALAPAELTAAVRAAAGTDLAAVLSTRSMPVDIRHNSKIDHPALRRAAQRLLAGRGAHA